MPISTTNVSLNAIHVECGGTSGTQVSLNEADIRGIGNPSSTYDGGDGISGGTTTQISIGEFRGAEDTVDYSPLVQTTGSMRLSSNGNGFTTFRSRTAGIVMNHASGVYARAVLSGNTVQLKIREFNSLSTSTYINNFNVTQTLSTTEVNGSSRTYNSGDVDAMKLEFVYSTTDSSGVGFITNNASYSSATYGSGAYHNVSNGQSVGGGISANSSAECYGYSERTIDITIKVYLRGNGFNDTLVATHTGSASSISTATNCF
jgi:hypothetical protein|tara:strand:+ start:4043 stop:4825 length:783 start_codon:yes stop_codon:yes gene_type:complete